MAPDYQGFQGISQWTKNLSTYRIMKNKLTPDIHKKNIGGKKLDTA